MKASLWHLYFIAMLELGAQQGPEGGEGQIAGKILIPRLKLCLVYEQYLKYLKLCLV